MKRFLIIFISCVIFYGMLLQAFRFFTDVNELNNHYPHVIFDPVTKTSEISIRNRPPAGYTPLSQISPIAVNAIVLSEDWAFYQHNGFDWEQIWDSFKTNLEKGKFARGGSTITQQTVKNIYLSKRKTLWRKLQEAVLVVRLERQVRKRRILELYLNVVEFGLGIYGIGPASRYYFQKSPSQLNAKEGAFLAMLLPSPKKYSISFRKRALTPFARGTIRGILAKLLATHRITESDYHFYLTMPLNFEIVPTAIPESTSEAEKLVTPEEGPDEQADDSGGED